MLHPLSTGSGAHEKTTCLSLWFDQVLLCKRRMKSQNTPFEGNIHRTKEAEDMGWPRKLITTFMIEIIYNWDIRFCRVERALNIPLTIGSVHGASIAVGNTDSVTFETFTKGSIRKKTRKKQIHMLKLGPLFLKVKPSIWKRKYPYTTNNFTFSGRVFVVLYDSCQSKISYFT